jgi:hypothetical protein
LRKTLPGRTVPLRQQQPRLLYRSNPADRFRAGKS